MKYFEFILALVIPISSSLVMAITNFKITPLPHEGKQFWIEYYIQEADPDDVAVVQLTQGFKAIVDKQYEKLVTHHSWFAAKTKSSVYA